MRERLWWWLSVHAPTLGLREFFFERWLRYQWVVPTRPYRRPVDRDTTETGVDDPRLLGGSS